MKLTKSKAIEAVGSMLGWRVKSAQVTVEGTKDLPIYKMQMGKMQAVVGSAASLTDCPHDSRPERYGLRTIIYIELHVVDLDDELLCTRYFFLDNLLKALSREEYQRRMDAVSLCDGLPGFDAEAAMAEVNQYERRWAIEEERMPRKTEQA